MNKQTERKEERKVHVFFKLRFQICLPGSLTNQQTVSKQYCILAQRRKVFNIVTLDLKGWPFSQYKL
jgi:hypothetical protein